MPTGEQGVKVHVSWDDFESQVREIVAQIERSGRKFDAVYGVPRGGLILAVRLSHLLGVPLVDTVRGNQRILVCDDISDEGHTLAGLYEETGASFHVACLYSTAWTSVVPDYCAAQKKRGEWVCFPWESPK